MKLTHFTHTSLLSMLIMLFANVLFAQPSNDRCDNPTLINLAVDRDSCIPVEGDTRGTEDATIVPSPRVCSGTWYADDVWYSLTIGSEAPEFGLVVEALFGDNTTDIPAVGMAIYNAGDCTQNNIPLECFSNEDGSERSLIIPPSCLHPLGSYLIRVWSGVSPTDNSGTFQLCAYESPDDPDANNPSVYWEEDFDDGFGEWTTIGISDSAEVWTWDEAGTFPDAFGSFIELRSFTASCNGAVALPAGYYQSLDSLLAPPLPYPVIESHLISPIIDLSGTDSLSLRYEEAFRGLNGSEESEFGALIDISLDGGNTWNKTIDANTSEDTEIQIVYNGRIKEFPLFDIAGEENVRLRFRFVGDFYFWIIDNVQMIDGLSNDGNNPVATDELSSSIKLDVQPNPASKIINVNFEFPQVLNAIQIDIMDVNGKLIESRLLKNIQRSAEVFDISKLTNGFYFLQLNTDLGVETRKIVVSH